MGKLRPSRKCASTNRGQKAAREVLRMMRVALLSKANAGGYGRSRSSTARNRRLCGMQHRSYANQDAVRLASQCPVPSAFGDAFLWTALQERRGPAPFGASDSCGCQS